MLTSIKALPFVDMHASWNPHQRDLSLLVVGRDTIKQEN